VVRGSGGEPGCVQVAEDLQREPSVAGAVAGASLLGGQVQGGLEAGLDVPQQLVERRRPGCT
jgi:hypothetical protein